MNGVFPCYQTCRKFYNNIIIPLKKTGKKNRTDALDLLANFDRQQLTHKVT